MATKSEIEQKLTNKHVNNRGKYFESLPQLFKPPFLIW